MAVSPQTNCTMPELASRLLECDDFVICGHVSPDGDCLGSQLALMCALRRAGKRAQVVLVKDEPIEPNLALALPLADELVFAGSFDGDCKTFIGVDVPTRERIGHEACALLDAADESFTIDHHAVEGTMCDHVYVDPDSASASLLVWELCDYLGVSREGDLATCCYTGLVTDTGRFQYQNTDERCFVLAAQMLEAGADPASISRAIFQNRTQASVRLEGIALSRMVLDEELGVAITSLSKADFQAACAVKSDAEPLIDILRSIGGVRVACVLREQEDCVRGSLRAKDATDVSAIARKFGGGGHVAAAGFTLHCSLDEAMLLLRKALVEAVRQS